MQVLAVAILEIHDVMQCFTRLEMFTSLENMFAIAVHLFIAVQSMLLMMMMSVRGLA